MNDLEIGADFERKNRKFEVKNLSSKRKRKILRQKKRRHLEQCRL